MKSTITQVLLFYKRYVYPFPVIHLLNPYYAEFACVRVCVCVWGGGGGGQGAVFYVFVFNAIFSDSELNTRILQNLKEYFHGQHF